MIQVYFFFGKKNHILYKKKSKTSATVTVTLNVRFQECCFGFYYLFNGEIMPLHVYGFNGQLVCNIGMT